MKDLLKAHGPYAKYSRLKRRAGVYAIQRPDNAIVYIGSSRNLEKRKYQYENSIRLAVALGLKEIPEFVMLVECENEESASWLEQQERNMIVMARHEGHPLINRQRPTLKVGEGTAGRNAQ